MSESANNRILSESCNWTMDELKRRSVESVRNMGLRLGDNPIVALSGGIDSQAVCLALRDAGIKFKIAIMEFNDGLNSHDVDSAKNFCTIKGFEYIIIPHDILSFLKNDLSLYVEKYQCPSPQITSHLRLFEILKDDHAASSIICGGNAPFIWKDIWCFGSTRSQTAWMTFAKIHNFTLLGNFLSYSLDIALPIMYSTPGVTAGMTSELAYQNKIYGLQLAGYDVIPQKQKYTGFEKIKNHFAQITNDGWAFEKAFRYKYTKVTPEYGSVLELDDRVSNMLSTYYSSGQFNKKE